MSDLADQDILLKVHRGDTRAFGLLYDRYKPRLIGYCYRLIGDRQSAEDIVQTSFMKAFASLSSLENPGSFSHWIFSIVRNEVYASLRVKRSNGTTLPIDSGEDVWDPDSPLDSLIRGETIEAVQRCLRQLRIEYREVLILRQYEKLSYAEIASLTGDTISAIESRLFKARKALAERLAPYFGPEDGFPGRHK